jgi:protein-L-isoaspartate(D-aspartate) O-methyltransferase
VCSSDLVPELLKHQLRLGGRMVVPVGHAEWDQMLVRVTRDSQNEFRRETLSGVRFVPLIGQEGWGPNR